MAATFPSTGARPAPKTADQFFELGRFLFALGLAMLGVQIPLVGDFTLGLAPVPAWLPLQLPLAYVSAAVLLGAAMSIASGWRARVGALAAAVLFFAWLLLLQLPRLAAAPADAAQWASAAQTLALFATAWFAAARAQPMPFNTTRSAPIDAGLVWASRAFGVCLLAFGALQWLLHDFVAAMIPAWLPAHSILAYFVGAADIAAGIAVITGVQGRLAALLLGGMFASWVVLLHIPRVMAAPGSRGEWTGLLIATALSGAAWLISSRFARKLVEPSTIRVEAAIQGALQDSALQEAA